MANLRALGILAIALSLYGCSPRDQDECKAQAARDTKGKEALDILVEQCEKQFPAVKQADGTYVYHDQELDEDVVVSGPQLGQQDIEKIKKLKEGKRKKDEQVKKDEDLKKLSDEDALSKVSVTQYKITCDEPSPYIACYNKNITISIFNGSDKIISGLYFGYEIGKNIDCTGSLGKNFRNPMTIYPGQNGTVVQNVMFEKAGPAGVMQGCVSFNGADKIE